MSKSKGRKSRRKTPWDGTCELTATQIFIKEQYKMRYADRHQKVCESGESEMINSYVPTKCPFCNSTDFNKRGLTASGIQRYQCSCKKAFIPTTGTIFDEHKLSIGEWIEYCLFSVMLVLMRTRGTTRTHLQRPDTGCKNFF